MGANLPFSDYLNVYDSASRALLGTGLEIQNTASFLWTSLNFRVSACIDLGNVTTPGGPELVADRISTPCVRETG
jgi:hypothetical protein